MSRFVLATILMLGIIAAPASAADTNFGRLFPNLPALNQNSDLDLADLADSQLDPNLNESNNCEVPADVPNASEGCVFSIMTYGGGQFFDHDATLDRAPSPFATVDPTTLENFRTFKLDLDSVYCGGPSVTPEIYEADGLHFKVQEVNPNGVRDLPRGPDTFDANGVQSNKALLCEGRNDENQVIAQFHLAFLKFHNRLIDEGMTFAQAQRYLTLHYQRAVVKELTDNTLSPGLGNPLRNLTVLTLAARQLVGDFTPVEFSVAAFRYGHSNVRRAYRLNGNGNCANLQVFANSAPGVQPADLRGGRQLQAGRQIDWGMFDDTLPKPAGCEAVDRNIQRKFDQLISSSLFLLPNPFVADRDNVLGFLNMIRAKHYGLPSGQAVAARLGQPVLTDAELIPDDPDLQARFAGGIPLWFYILRESSIRENGQRLGPVGSRIVASSFLAMLLRDQNSILRRNIGFRPDPRVAGPDGEVELTDIVSFAGTAR